jgi:hypothetical protein
MFRPSEKKTAKLGFYATLFALMKAAKLAHRISPKFCEVSVEPSLW